MVTKKQREPIVFGFDGYDEYEDDMQPDRIEDGAETTSRRFGMGESPRPRTREPTLLEDSPRGVPGRPLPDPGDGIVPRQWRQWYSRANEREIAPLVVEQPRHARWGRFVYLAIVLAGMLIGLDFLAGQSLWYNAKGTVGGRQYPLSPTDVATVDQILVSPGEHVRKGQVLVRMASPQLRREIAQTSVNIAGIESRRQDQAHDRAATVAALRAEISGLQLQDNALNEQYDSRRQQIISLFRLAAKGAINYSDALEMQQQQAQTQAQSAQVEAKMEADRAQVKILGEATRNAKRSTADDGITSLDRLRDSLSSSKEDLTLRSPLDGIVAQVPVTQGQTVRPGETAIILVPNNRQRTLLYFPPAARPQLSVGETFDVSTPDGNSVPMRISHIYPSIQDLPDDLRDRVGDEAQKIVVAAQPVDAKDIDMLQSGTPVTARVSRWGMHGLFTRLRDTVGGWVGAG